MTISEKDHDVIFELYKLCSAVLPEKNTWSIDEISQRLFIESESSKNTKISKDRLKEILKELEQKQAVIFVNGFEVVNLVEPKLLELANASKAKKNKME